jgi:hypothetical protein
MFATTFSFDETAHHEFLLRPLWRTIQPSKLRAPNGRLSQRKSSGGIERPRRLFAPTKWRAIFTNRQVNPYL